MNDPAGGVASGMGTCGMVGPIGVYAGWVNDVATGAKAAITGTDWLSMALICFILLCIRLSGLARVLRECKLNPFRICTFLHKQGGVT